MRLHGGIAAVGPSFFYVPACSKGLYSRVDVAAENLQALSIVIHYYRRKQAEYYEAGI